MEWLRARVYSEQTHQETHEQRTECLISTTTAREANPHALLSLGFVVL